MYFHEIGWIIDFMTYLKTDFLIFLQRPLISYITKCLVDL